MEPRGGFVHYVRLRRLHHCRDDLVNPAHMHRSIADIAATWGFNNPSAFSTAFKELFDMSPRDFRHYVRGRTRRMNGLGSESDWSRWLAALLGGVAFALPAAAAPTVGDLGAELGHTVRAGEFFLRPAVGVMGTA